MILYFLNKTRAGQERFRTITSSYYRGADAIIITYDITRKETFVQIEKWLKEVKQYSSTDICKVLVGCKADLIQQRQVSLQEIQTLSDKSQLQFFETSSKENYNVKETFSYLIHEIYTRRKPIQAQDLSDVPPPPSSPLNKSLTKAEKLFLLIGILFKFYDLLGDILVLLRFYNLQDWWWFGISVFILLFSSIVTAFFAGKAGGSVKKIFNFAFFLSFS